ncbi:hypothetical protein SLA2020_059150 [Shorea laevis]
MAKPPLNTSSPCLSPPSSLHSPLPNLVSDVSAVRDKLQVEILVVAGVSSVDQLNKPISATCVPESPAPSPVAKSSAKHSS